MCGVAKALKFGVGVIGLGLLPTKIGLQDCGALAAPAPIASEPIREHLPVSPFGTIHAALFSFPRPAGADMPHPVEFRLASLDFEEGDRRGSVGTRALFDMGDHAPVFPEVSRTQKGDRLVPQVKPEPASAPTPVAAPRPQQGAERGPSDGALTYALTSVPLGDVAPALGEQAGAPEDSAAGFDTKRAAPNVNTSPEVDTALEAESATKVALAADAAPDAKTQPSIGPASTEASTNTNVHDDDDIPTLADARIYFGAESMRMLAAMQPWAPDDFVMFDWPDEADVPASAAPGGETIAAKGEVTGAGQHPKSPAERLGLAGPARARAEKCLANAVYFEARGEPVRGQIAVAQVVMNRVFSGYYPDNVCGVVYQNANRRFACQFTFACDGTRDRVDEPDAWRRAKEIARDTLDGKLWLPDVGKATHYHAYWVRPGWIREMHKLDRIGVHTFYRPRNWGDGADAPVWGDAATTKEEVEKL